MWRKQWSKSRSLLAEHQLDMTPLDLLLLLKIQDVATPRMQLEISRLLGIARYYGLFDFRRQCNAIHVSTTKALEAAIADRYKCEEQIEEASVTSPSIWEKMSQTRKSSVQENQRLVISSILNFAPAILQSQQWKQHASHCSKSTVCWRTERPVNDLCWL